MKGIYKLKKCMMCGCITTVWFMLSVGYVCATVAHRTDNKALSFGPGNNQLSAKQGANVTPVVLTDSRGLVWRVWANIQGDKSVLVYAVKENGHWSPPEEISTGLKNSIAPCLIEDDSGGVWAFFSGNDGIGNDDIYGIRWIYSGWSDPFRVNKGNSTPDILPYATLGDDGRLVVTWACIRDGKYALQSAVFAEGHWSETTGPLEKKIHNSSVAENPKEIDLPVSAADDGVPPLSVAILRSIQDQGKTLSDSFLENSVAKTDEPDAVQKADEYIISFGDSITWDSGGKSYRGELLRLLNQDGRNVQIYNWGSAGETTVDGVIRLGRFLDLVDADFFLLLEGTNDIRFGISYQATMANLDMMLNKVMAAGIVPLFSNLTPDGTSNDFNDLIVDTYNPGIKKIALRKKIILVDNYTPLAGSWADYTVDGLHPNASGFLVMGKTWFKALPEKIKLPVVQTGNATDIKLHEATLTALVFPNGTDARYFFEYGAGGNELDLVSKEFPLAGNASQTAVEIQLKNLTKETVYRYRIKAINAVGEATGDILSFKTGEKQSSSGGGSGGCFINTLTR